MNIFETKLDKVKVNIGNISAIVFLYERKLLLKGQAVQKNITIH